MSATSDTIPVPEIPVNGKHGYSGNGGTSEYGSWAQMKQRCFNPNDAAHHNYGGRGITVCDRWKQSFKDFIADMGRKPSPKHSLDRIKNNADYSCGKCAQCLSRGWEMNCRWGTKQQQDNNRRTTTMLTHNGVTMSMKQWARHLGMPYGALRERIKHGWSVARALTETLQHKSHPVISFEGQAMSLAGWSRKTGVDADLIFWRLNHGWSTRDALCTKPRSLYGPRS